MSKPFNTAVSLEFCPQSGVIPALKNFFKMASFLFPSCFFSVEMRYETEKVQKPFKPLILIILLQSTPKNLRLMNHSHVILSHFVTLIEVFSAKGLITFTQININIVQYKTLFINFIYLRQGILLQYQRKEHS